MNISIGITDGVGITMIHLEMQHLVMFLLIKIIYFRQVETGGKYTFDDDINDIKLIQDKR